MDLNTLQKWNKVEKAGCCSLASMTFINALTTANTPAEMGFRDEDNGERSGYACAGCGVCMKHGVSSREMIHGNIGARSRVE